MLELLNCSHGVFLRHQNSHPEWPCSVSPDHRRQSDTSIVVVQGLAKAMEEVARRVKDMRNPSPEFLREQALKIAEYKSPGMWVLMDRYQRFADELKAEATMATKPAGSDADTSAGAGANPKPEVAAEVGLHVLCLSMALFTAMSCHPGSLASWP